MSRRTVFGIVVPLVLIAAYFGVTSSIRAHVDDLVQHAVDRPLPDFRLVDRSGRAWSKQDLLGKRAVLHFFRSYCHSCDVEAPAIRALEAAICTSSSGRAQTQWASVSRSDSSPISFKNATPPCG